MISLKIEKRTNERSPTHEKSSASDEGGVFTKHFNTLLIC
jgi:hypothetical protein